MAYMDEKPTFDKLHPLELTIACKEISAYVGDDGAIWIEINYTLKSLTQWREEGQQYIFDDLLPAEDGFLLDAASVYSLLTDDLELATANVRAYVESFKAKNQEMFKELAWKRLMLDRILDFIEVMLEEAAAVAAAPKKKKPRKR